MGSFVVGQCIRMRRTRRLIWPRTSRPEGVLPDRSNTATGRAVVTADTPAAREVFTHGETAWLCPAASPDALADAIRCLCDDPSLRRRIGRQPKNKLTRLAGHAKIDLLRRVVADDPGQFDADAGNAATAFGEDAAANESD